MALDATDLQNFDLLSNLQGNILKGHGRDHTAHIFIHFDPDADKIKKAKEWIKKLAEESITSTQKQLKEREIFKRNNIPGGLFTSFYLSAKGYEALGLVLPPDLNNVNNDQHNSFEEGMKGDKTQQKLADPAVCEWEEGYKGEIHAMLLLADDSVDQLGRVAKEIIEEIDIDTLFPAENEGFVNILHIEYGNAIRNANGDGLEHFGYVDGISQPLFLKDEVDGFRKGKRLPLNWDPEADTSLVLVPDMAGKPTANGSYFVFRKLEQRVKAFKTAEKELAKALGLPEGERERAGAMIVGRYEDGTPLALNEEDGIIASGDENNFNYNGDGLGAKCPFHAHIRKSNPRGTSPFETLEDEKKHIMARRGIPFGFRNVNTNIDPAIPQMPDDGVGLLFMSYQASLSNQFEFIQSLWVNNKIFPKKDAGSDPILSQRNIPPTIDLPHGLEQEEISTGRFAKIYGVDISSDPPLPFDSFVKMKGGEYFFAPSIPFLKSL